jgi:RNA polymerase sigma factor (sigma-70 family)
MDCQPDQDNELLDLDQALDELLDIYPRPMQIVKLRFFGGLSNLEIAELLNISTATVERDWRFARALLHQRLSDHK